MANEIAKREDETTAVVTAKPPRRKSEFAQVGKMRDEHQAGLEADAHKLTDHQLSGVTRIWAAQTEEELLEMVHALVAVRELINPRDMIEGMLVTQMIGMQEAAMRNMQRASANGLTSDFIDKHLSIANKCTRTFAALVDTLNKHRGKGQQKVTVEHVHVHAGGQAIVGSVDAGGMAGVDAKSA